MVNCYCVVSVFFCFVFLVSSFTIRLSFLSVYFCFCHKLTPIRFSNRFGMYLCSTQGKSFSTHTSRCARILKADASGRLFTPSQGERTNALFSLLLTCVHRPVQCNKNKIGTKPRHRFPRMNPVYTMSQFYRRPTS